MWRIFVSAMMMLLLLVGVAGAQEASQGYQIKENQINSEYVEGKYPTVDVDNILIKSKINSQIEKIVNKYIDYTNQQNTDGYEVTGFVSYDIRANNQNFFSLTIDCSSMLKDAAHPNTYTYGLTFDNKGNVINFSQIIQEDKMSGKNLYTVNNLTKEVLAQFGDKIYDSNFIPLNITAFPKEFYIDDDGNLHVLFQRYEITPYAVGLVDVIMQ
jgi:hypothetical protein